MAKSNKILRYRIYGIVDIEAESPGEIEDVLERIREVGDAGIVGVEVLDANEPLPDIHKDFAVRKGK